MTVQDDNLEWKQFPEGWRANFYDAAIAHSVVLRSAYEPTPWRAVQRAAWAVLNDG